MTPDEALKLAQEACRGGRYCPTNHFRDRMEDRKATAGDVRRAILTADRAQRQPNGSWRLYGGQDADEVDLVPVFEIKGETLHLITIL